MRPCEVTGCGKPAVGFGCLCGFHKARARRAGHPEQTTITAARIRPYTKRVERAVRSLHRDDAWSLLEATVGHLKDHCRERLDETKGRRSRWSRWVVRGWEEALKVLADAPPRKIVTTVAALALMQHREPRAFKSDRAYFVALSRRFRALTDLNVGSYWNEAEKKTTRVYRDLPPNAAEFLGKLLAQHFAAVCAGVIRTEQANAGKERGAEQGVRELFGSGPSVGKDQFPLCNHSTGGTISHDDPARHHTAPA